MTVDKIIPCICCDHPPSVDDRSEYGMPVLKLANSSIPHLQFYTAECPFCGRGGVLQFKSAYLALKNWNEMQQQLYESEHKPIIYQEDWKDTCKRLGYDYEEWYCHESKS